MKFAIFVEFVYYCQNKLLSLISVSFKSFVFSGRFESGKKVSIGKVSIFIVDMFTLQKPDLKLNGMKEHQLLL